jgi:hypothetical protein
MVALFAQRSVEVGDDKIIARFREASRNAEYLDLFDASRNMSLRLYLNKVFWKQPETEWFRLPVKGQGTREIPLKDGQNPRGMTDCSLWRYAYEDDGRKGSFVKLGTEWLEVGDDRAIARFREASRNADYLDLFDASRNMSLRLYLSKVFWKQPETEWFRLPVKGQPSRETSIIDKSNR